MKDLFDMDPVAQYDKSVHAKNGRARVFKTLGASNHTEQDRGAFDYYATEPKATELLLKLEHFNNNILEPCCGEGHISEVLKRGRLSENSRRGVKLSSEHSSLKKCAPCVKSNVLRSTIKPQSSSRTAWGGYHVTSRDLINHGYGEQADFLDMANTEWNGDIITNPPYALAKEFVEKAIRIIPRGNKVAMFLKLTFLEGKQRRELFRIFPPIRVWVSSSRLACAMNGDFEKYSGSATAYAWFIWQKGFKGDPIIKWFN